MMTLAVYRVDKDGNRQEVRPEYVVAPLQLPNTTSAWPPCKCSRCTRAREHRCAGR